MPYVYMRTQGDRPLEFWKTYRGGNKSEVVNVPKEWDDDRVEYELEQWCQLQYHNSDFMRYGWNDNKDFGSRS